MSISMNTAVECLNLSCSLNWSEINTMKKYCKIKILIFFSILEITFKCYCCIGQSVVP